MRSLIDSAKRGDRIALASLIDSHKELAFNVAYSMLKNEDDARDVTQQSFLIVLEKLADFRNEAAFSTWLYRIVYHESLRQIKNRVLHQHAPLDEHMPSHFEVGREASDDKERIREALERLNEHERIAMTLFYLGEQSVRQVADITGFTEANIKVLLHRGRKQLKTYLNLAYDER